jgi:hypothetical protein
MAKRSSDHDSGPDKGKIRIFFAEVEGNNESLQDALKTVVAAMNRSGAVQIAAPTARIGSKSLVAVTPEAEQSSTDNEEATDIPEESLSAESNDTTATTRKRGTGAKKDRNAGINLVPNLDFRPKGKQSLKEFFAEKMPRFDQEQVLVVVYYMQHTLTLPSIGLGHVLTAFKDVGKPVPVDLRSTIRNIKKKKAFLNFTDMKAIRTTTQGNNYVEHDLPAKKNQ